MNDWDISRDAPYFGIEIPDEPGKYFYVWLDAPIGYLASLKSYCELKSINFDGLLESSTTEQIHIIGKDIAYFHTLFWPSMLHFSGKPFKVPDHVWAHGFVTVNGMKMSKSRGTGLNPLVYLDLGMDPEWLRYYFAAKINSRVEDIDFTTHAFVTMVNSNLVGKYVNIASRSSGFLLKRFEGKVSDKAIADSPLLRELREQAGTISRLYEDREYNRVLNTVLLLLIRQMNMSTPRSLGNLLRIRKEAKSSMRLLLSHSKRSDCSPSISNRFFREPPKTLRTSSTAES